MSQFTTPAFDVEKPKGVCAVTGRELAPGETYMATLVAYEPDPAGARSGDAAPSGPPSRHGGIGLRRLDVSMEVWESGRRPEGLFSYWKSRVPEKEEKKRVFVDDTVLMNLLERLADETAERRLAFRFVLMLVLMRKKLLRYERTEQREGEGGRAESWWVLTPKLEVSRGPLGKWDASRQLEVFDPGLDETAIAEISEQLGEILGDAWEG